MVGAGRSWRQEQGLSLSQTVRPPGSQRPGKERWDVIVIGCGVMGASTSYNLAMKGLRVLNIERHGVNHKYGSSHGRTRIIRLIYYEDSRYVPLLRRAYEAWREVGSKSGKNLLRMTGGLMVGKSDGDLIQGATQSARAHGLPHDVLSAPEANDRFEAFNLSEDLVAVYDPSAGVLSAEDSVRSFVGLGSQEGCEFRFSEEVKGLRVGPEGIAVQTSLGTQTASRIVLCGGGWNGALLEGAIPLTCERQVPLWFPSRGQDRFAAEKMPVFVMEEGRDVYYYGIPDLGHGVKVARHHGGETGEPDALKRQVTDADAIPVSAFVTKRMNGLDPAPTSSTICFYTNTPDLDFVLGAHPTEPRITIVGGFSGHGFKFASVVGEVAACLATDEKVPYDVSFLRPDRFRTSKGAA